MTAVGFVCLALCYVLFNFFGKDSLFEYNWADKLAAYLFLVGAGLIVVGLAVVMWRSLP
jgi:hypothetical protein